MLTVLHECRVPVYNMRMSAANRIKKTNAMRILEDASIPYEVLLYDDDGEHKLELGAAVRIAETLHLDAAAVFKTIVMRTEAKEICVFCVPARLEVNAKKGRISCGAKEIASVKPDELNALTGYVRGGCSPLGMKRRFRTFIDESAQLFGTVYVSAGVRGVQLALDPQHLAAAANAVFCDLT
ncbi:YbaK/prolyl-tRNA synthetase associated region [Treponema brennaborense DSM 12168]|uniref:Cys-tRNA(Pro)/Cys-tRNA(Cys) deacylase n=2 Tax=Treponema TaxID=157 RepID=F4LJM7_TREBD|nr:YbaK/prolyl-tRNA synthetase associated region [Treponema brennaborense DSM 12168]